MELLTRNFLQNKMTSSVNGTLANGATASRKYMRVTLLVLVMFATVVVVGCDSTTERDSRPSFVLDPSKPFVVEFGRGSGMWGLDIVRIDENGMVELERLDGGQNVQSASLQLTPTDVKTVADLVNRRQLTSLGRNYIDRNISDGTQWVLWIEQGPSQKSVYFSNSFPTRIVGFADELDALLAKAGFNAVTWTPVPAGQGEDRQSELWDRIK